MSITNAERDFCFGKGSDDRLAGVPFVNSCFWYEPELLAWQAGWRHVDKYWGVDARWPVSDLCEVRRQVRGF